MTALSGIVLNKSGLRGGFLVHKMDGWGRSRGESMVSFTQGRRKGKTPETSSFLLGSQREGRELTHLLFKFSKICPEHFKKQNEKWSLVAASNFFFPRQVGYFHRHHLWMLQVQRESNKNDTVFKVGQNFKHLINTGSFEKALLAVEYLNIKLKKHFENWERKCGPIGSIIWSTGPNHCDHTTEIIAITAKKSNTSQHSWDQANDSLCFKCELLKAGIRKFKDEISLKTN